MKKFPPQRVIDSLPESITADVNATTIFYALYRHLAEQAENSQITPDELQVAALYLTCGKMFEATQQTPYFNACGSLDKLAQEYAQKYQLPLDELLKSGVYHVPTITGAQDYKNGNLPEKSDTAYPHFRLYSDAVQNIDAEYQAQHKLTMDGPRGMQLPSQGEIAAIYTVIVPEAYVQALEEAGNKHMLDAATVSSVTSYASEDLLHDAYTSVEAVDMNAAPTHDAMRRVVSIRSDHMRDFQMAYMKTPIVDRDAVSLTEQNQSIKSIFANTKLTEASLVERAVHMFGVDLRMRADAKTWLSFDKFSEVAKSTMADILTDTGHNVPTVQELSQAIQAGVTAIFNDVSSADRHIVQDMFYASTSMAKTLMREQADILLDGKDVQPDVLAYIRSGADVYPEKYRDEFIVRAADGLSNSDNMRAAMKRLYAEYAERAQYDGDMHAANQFSHMGDGYGLNTLAEIDTEER